MNAHTNRTYLITGITDENSLAMAAARELCASGARLVCTGLGLTPHHEGLSERAAEFLQRTYSAFEQSVERELGEDVLTMPLDVTLDGSIADFAGALRDKDVKLDGLLHAIAMDKTIRHGAVKPLLEVTRDEFMQTMNTSAYSLIALTRALVEHEALAHGGAIVAVSYRGARYIMEHPYKNVGVAKAALERIIRELAVELGESHGMRVNGIRFSPYTKSRAGGAIPGLEEVEARCEQLSPLGNARAEDFAFEVAQLLCGDCRVTGDIRNVDGGYHLRG